MNIFTGFKSKPMPTVAGLHRITEFFDAGHSHVATPEGCKQFGFQLGYNEALDFYQKHGMIPEPNKSVVALNHWKKFVAFGKVEGHNKAVADLIQKELSL